MSDKTAVLASLHFADATEFMSLHICTDDVPALLDYYQSKIPAGSSKPGLTINLTMYAGDMSEAGQEMIETLQANW